MEAYYIYNLNVFIMADIQKLNVNGNTYDISTTWAKVTGKPSTFPPSSHTHDGRYIKWGGSAADTNAMSWGALTTANGYTILSHVSSSDGGDWGMVNKSGKIFMQLDGYYYQNEGRYRVTDVSETVTTLGTSGNYLTWTKNGATNNITVPYASSAGGVAWSNVTSKPSFFTPARYGTQSTHNYYKIKINSARSWMLAFNVRVYKSYNFFDIRFSGYNYGTNYWYSPVASLTDGDSAITVYFGYDSAWNLWVAIPGGSYTGIEITNACNGYTQVIGPDLSSLFTISAVDSLSGTIQSTQTIQPPSRLGHTHTKSQITDFPTSMPASDVYSWAKASSKPTYTYSEVGAAAASHTHSYLPLSGGTLNGNLSLEAYELYWNGDTEGSYISSNGTTDMIYNMRQGHIFEVGGNRILSIKRFGNYNLQVYGSANATTLYENGTRVALSGHTHSYLPLSGGTVSFIITST